MTPSSPFSPVRFVYVESRNPGIDRAFQAGRDRVSLRSRLRGGEGGIRTLGTGVSPYNGLANRRIRPLCHLSGLLISTIRTGYQESLHERCTIACAGAWRHSVGWYQRGYVFEQSSAFSCSIVHHRVIDGQPKPVQGLETTSATAQNISSFSNSQQASWSELNRPQGRRSSPSSRSRIPGRQSSFR